MTDDGDRTKPPAEVKPAEVKPAEVKPAEVKVEDVEDVPVPRLPRGRGIRLSRPQLVRIAGTVFLLVFLLVVQRPCANAVSTFVTGFGSAGDRGSAAALMPRPGTMDVPPGAGTAGGSAGGSQVRSGSGSAAGPDTLDLDQYEHLRPGMTDEEVQAVIERARRKAAGGSAVP
jgi:hypothetical protein